LDSSRGATASITTPTFPSLFFQESKGSPSGGGATGASTQSEEKNGSAKVRDIQRHHPYSKMICISPLASSKKQRCKSTGDLPAFSLNKDDKAKRKLETYDDLLNVPLSSPTMHVMDMHVAEKDIMEDEDLSMLLHLASSSSAGQRSPGSKKFPTRRTSNPTPSSLQLPLMGGPEASTSDSRFPPKLDRMPFRKNSTSNQVIRSMSNEFAPPALSMRPTKGREIANTTLKSKSNEHGDNPKTKSKPPKRSTSASVKKSAKGSSSRNSSSDMQIPSNNRKQNSSMMHPGPPPYPPMPAPSGNYQYPAPPPHPIRMHHPPPGGHGYHDGMNHSGPPPMGDRRPMQHHMPPNGYPPNPNPHMRPHSIPPGQMPGPSAGPGPYHYSHPPQGPIQGSGQYAPYTSLNQSHSKSKMPGKKGPGYGPNAHNHNNMKQKTKKGKASASPGTKRQSSDMQGTGKKKARTPSKRKKNAALSKLKAAKIDPNDKNSQAAALAAAILRGVTMRPSGKWVSCQIVLFFFHFKI